MAYPTRPRPRPRRSAHRRAIYRRRRLTVLAVLALVVALVYVVASPGGSKHPSRSATNRGRGGAATAAAADPPIPAVEAGVLPWTLASAVSREVVLPGGGSSLLVIGGLDAGQASTSTIYSLDVTSGNETVQGHLAAATHDAGGAVVAGRVDLFGGGSPATIPAVEQFAASPGMGTPTPAPTNWQAANFGGEWSPANAAPPGNAPVVITGATTTATAPAPLTASSGGNLPRPRSDLSAVTVGTTTYVVGGYTGSAPDADIWATTDGVNFKVAGQLVTPVRYGAVVAHAGLVYVFGGQAVGGPTDGAAVASVQVFDPSSRKVKVVGSLPQALAGSTAVDLDGNVYIAGGVGNGAAAAPGAAVKVSTTAVNSVWAWDTNTNRALPAGTLQVPIAYAGAAVTYGRAWLIGGESQGQPQTTVQMFLPNAHFGHAGATGAGSPYFGDKLLIADRGNDRLLVMTPGDHVVWSYPSVYAAAPPGGFYFPDDAFFANHGTEIISNQEENHTLVIIAFPSGQVLWQYGHPLVEGSAPGYLSWPDDAYLLKNGQITVADDRNCRILFITQATKAIASQIGATGACTHNPPSGVDEPNGDTPLPDGNYLVSEIIGQWISEYTEAGQLVWTTHLNMHYPSDPQPLGPDLYVVSDYAQYPGGAIDEFNKEGQILYRLQPSQGPGRMDQPSLTEMLPSGVFMSNDDYNDRMVAFDPPTGALVWQYGVTGKPGTAAGYLNIPDGFDLLTPSGATPTHPTTA